MNLRNDVDYSFYVFWQDFLQPFKWYLVESKFHQRLYVSKNIDPISHFDGQGLKTFSVSQVNLILGGVICSENHEGELHFLGFFGDLLRLLKYLVSLQEMLVAYVLLKIFSNELLLFDILELLFLNHVLILDDFFSLYFIVRIHIFLQVLLLVGTLIKIKLILGHTLGAVHLFGVLFLEDISCIQNIESIVNSSFDIFLPFFSSS